MNKDLQTIEQTTPNNISASIEEARAIAEIKGMLTIAMSCPRDPVASEQRIKNSCGIMGLAETAEYSFVKGGKEIVGPSIRLAEVIAQNWGNISFGIKELRREHDQSIYKAYAWDMQTNSRVEEEFTVAHKQFGARNGKALTQDREIMDNNSSVGKRKLRNCIFAIIPPYVVDSAVAECRATINNNIKTDDKAIKALMDAFKDYDVSRSQIEQHLGRSIESISARQVIALRRIYSGLKDGLGVVADYFKEEVTEDKPAPKKKGNAGLKEQLKPEKKSENKVDSQNYVEYAKNLVELIAGCDTIAELHTLECSEDEMFGKMKKDDAKTWEHIRDELSAKFEELNETGTEKD